MDGNTEQGRNIRDDSSSVHPKLRGKRKATDDASGTSFCCNHLMLLLRK